MTEETLTSYADPAAAEALHGQQGIKELATQYNSYFVHAIVPDEWLEDSSPLMSGAASFDTKLDISLAYRPHLAGSALSPDHPNKNIFYDMGLLIADGTVSEVYGQDVRSSAGGLQARARSNGMPASGAAIEDVINDKDPRHNEVTIQNPVFAGLYWRPQNDSTSTGSETLPEELTEAHERLGLPVYVIGKDALARPIIELGQDQSFLLGEPVLPEAIEAQDSELDADAVKEDLLERAVFKVAGQERELVSSSEKGRLAYLAEYGEADEAAEFKTTDKSGYSWIASIAIKEGVGLVTISEKNDSASGKNTETREYSQANEIARSQYAVTLPWIGQNGMEKYGLDPDELQGDRSVDYLDYVERCVEGARAVIANIDEDPELLDIKRRINPDIATEVENYLQNIGSNLFGFATEADSHKDEALAKRARKLAESLIAEDTYQKTIDKRISDKTGDFRLTPEDLL